MANNYDSTDVGVPYVRAHKVTLHWPDNGLLPSYVLEQSLGVKLKDGTVRTIETLPTISRSLDFVNDGDLPIPLVDPTSGANLGIDTTLNKTMLSILAVVRQEQLKG